jgi:hypothetical protein
VIAAPEQQTATVVGSSFNDPDIVTCLAELGPVTGHLEPTCHRRVRATKLVLPCHQTWRSLIRSHTFWGPH